MDQHRADLAYQPFQSVMAFGSGGTWGTGIGKGLQTLYLPEAHNDFIAAIIGEELGFVGILALCVVYLALVARGVRAAFRAPDDYGAYLAFGISTMFGVQALVNLSRRARDPPDQGPHAAVPQLRRLVAARERGRRRHPAQHLASGRAASGRRVRGARRPPAPEVEDTAIAEALAAEGPRGMKTDPHRRRRHRRPRVSRARRRATRSASSPTCDVVFAGIAARPRDAHRPAARLHARAARRRADEGRGTGARGPRRARRGEGDASCDRARRSPPAERRAQRRRLRRGPGRARVRARRACPLAILEPNSILGLANRLLAPFAARAYVAWPETGAALPRRQGAPSTACRSARASSRAPTRAKPGARRVLVLGGSQGATALNERVPARHRARLCRTSATSTSCTRRARIARPTSAQAYERAGDRRRATVVPFLDDVAEQMAAADVVIARAGAVTVAEIAAIGRASILVPFPYAADDHQAKNAMALADARRRDLHPSGGRRRGSPRDRAHAAVRGRGAARAHGRGRARARPSARRARRRARSARRSRASAAGREGPPPPHKPMNGGTNGSSTMKFRVSSSKGVS